MEHFDQYLSRTLKKGLASFQPPASMKAQLLAEATQISTQRGNAWKIFSAKTSENLYRVHVNRAVGWSEHLDCLMASCSLEVSISHQRLVS